jgi:hypothetical protein
MKGCRARLLEAGSSIHDEKQFTALGPAKAEVEEILLCKVK